MIQDDKKNFDTSLLAGHPFERKYSLFGGRIIVHLACPTWKEMGLVLAELERRQQEGAPPATLLREGKAYRLLAYLRCIELDGNQIVFEGLESRVSAGKPLRGALSSLDFADEALYNILEVLAERFKKLLRDLSKRVADPEAQLLGHMIDKYYRGATRDGQPALAVASGERHRSA